jgi:DnaK suppressor protein
MKNLNTKSKNVASESIKMVGLTEKKKYTEKELAEFKLVIMGKLEQAKSDHLLLKETLCYKSTNDTSDTSPVFKVMEDGSEVETREETAFLASRQEKLIRDLQNALVRIEHKTYGICRVTGKLIPRQRLLSVPHATLCIDAKLEQKYN